MWMTAIEMPGDLLPGLSAPSGAASPPPRHLAHAGGTGRPVGGGCGSGQSGRSAPRPCPCPGPQDRGRQRPSPGAGPGPRAWFARRDGPVINRVGRMPLLGGGRGVGEIRTVFRGSDAGRVVVVMLADVHHRATCPAHSQDQTGPAGGPGTRSSGGPAPSVGCLRRQPRGPAVSRRDARAEPYIRALMVPSVSPALLSCAWAISTAVDRTTSSATAWSTMPAVAASDPP